jgi:hypothetical protein
MRFLVQLGSLDFADGSTCLRSCDGIVFTNGQSCGDSVNWTDRAWLRAGDDPPAVASALEDEACADAAEVRSDLGVSGWSGRRESNPA